MRTNSTDPCPSDLATRLEDQAKKQFFAQRLPHKNHHRALWHVLTAVEDYIRMMFAGRVQLPEQAIEARVDHAKYGLRYCIERISCSNLKTSIVRPPDSTNPKAYKRAFALFTAALDYNDAKRVCASLRAGYSSLHHKHATYRLIYNSSVDTRYAALEVLGHARAPEADVTTYLYHWLNRGKDMPDAVQRIVQTTNADHDANRINYDYQIELAYSLSQEVPQRRELFPRDFRFPWGSGYHTQILINALQIRCLYHVLSVHMGAIEHSIPGGADSSLVLVIDRDTLARDLSVLADIGFEAISYFIEHVTLGYRTKTPDPALQPLVPAGNDTLSVPCFHILTCNLQRSLLSLLSRIDAPAFDRQSAIFERDMVSDARGLFEENYAVRSNKTFKIDDQTEEVDLLVADLQNRTLLLLELRWMLQPGDPREIENRIRSCHQKIRQTQRKSEFVQRNLTQILERTFPDEFRTYTPSNWETRSLIIIEGYSGQCSTDALIPITTTDILRIAVSTLDSADAIHNWIKSLTWLPQNGLHFSHANTVHHFGTMTIERPTIEILQGPASYYGYVSEQAQRRQVE